MICARCHGPLYLDSDFGVPVVTSALACYAGCTRIELDNNGEPLALPASHGVALEQQIIMMHGQGMSPTMIARYLRLGVRMVRGVVGERQDRQP